MIVANPLVFNEKKPLEEQMRILQRQLDKLFDAMQGRLSFGTGIALSRGQNIQGQFVSFTSHAVANTEFSVTHSLNSVPIGYILLWQDKAGSLYQGPATGTAWTGTAVYLKCSVASVTFSSFLIPQGAMQ